MTALSAYISPTSPGDHYALALYTDNGGSPDTLVINSGSTTVSGLI